jgi:hypothetical protein
MCFVIALISFLGVSFINTTIDQLRSGHIHMTDQQPTSRIGKPFTHSVLIGEQFLDPEALLHALECAATLGKSSQALLSSSALLARDRRAVAQHAELGSGNLRMAAALGRIRSRR